MTGLTLVAETALVLIVMTGDTTLGYFGQRLIVATFAVFDSVLAG